jgi:membrane-bound lytic murein transglycosylase D
MEERVQMTKYKLLALTAMLALAGCATTSGPDAPVSNLDLGTAGKDGSARVAKAPEGTGPAVIPSGPLSAIQPLDLSSLPVASLEPPADLWSRIRVGFKMPNLDNELVHQQEQWYATRTDYLQRMTDRSRKYLFHIVEELERRNMPTELALLPMIESAFNPQAVSSASAAGMWQFMPATGKQFLRVDKAIDERRDPLESTRAAAAFLKQAYDALGSWPLAITSYNYGPAGVARAVAEIGSDNLVELIQKYNHPYWGYAPKNFYAEFLVAVDIGKNVNQYFPELELDAPRGIKEVELRGRTSLNSLVNSSGMTHGQFLDWNPALTSKTKFIPAGYRVKLPTHKTMEPVVQVAQEKSQPEPQRAQVIRHRVQRGETLVQIARRYGASAERILHINGMRRASAIRAGTTLLVPKL